MGETDSNTIIAGDSNMAPTSTVYTVQTKSA